MPIMGQQLVLTRVRVGTLMQPYRGQSIRIAMSAVMDDLDLVDLNIAQIQHVISKTFRSLILLVI